MKIALVSDSHDNLYFIKKFLKDVEKRNVDLIIHLGDIISPFSAREFLKVEKKIIAIYGNNDGEQKGLSSLLDIRPFPRELKIENKIIILYHDPIFDEDKLDGIDFLFYGHTHKKYFYKKGNTTILNPGELCGYLTSLSTYITLDLKNPIPHFHTL